MRPQRRLPRVTKPPTTPASPSRLRHRKQSISLALTSLVPICCIREVSAALSAAVATDHRQPAHRFKNSQNSEGVIRVCRSARASPCADLLSLRALCRVLEICSLVTYSTHLLLVALALHAAVAPPRRHAARLARCGIGGRAAAHGPLHQPAGSSLIRRRPIKPLCLPRADPHETFVRMS